MTERMPAHMMQASAQPRQTSFGRSRRPDMGPLTFSPRQKRQATRIAHWPSTCGSSWEGQDLVEVRGFEPLASAVRRQRSTPELHPRAGG